MSTSSEKLVKQTIKLLSKTQELNYEELKVDAKKVIKMARNHDSEMLAIMEEIMELSSVGSAEELVEFNIEVLKIYCKIKELDDSGSPRRIREIVWEHIESEFELESDEESGDDESVVDSGDESEETEVVIQESEPIVIKKKKEKVKVITTVES